MTAHPRPRRVRGLRWALAAIAVVVVLALVLQPWWLAPFVSQHLSARSGRAVHIDAMWLGVASSGQPTVQLRGIRVDNAPWADTTRPMAALASATAVFSWRSVAERRPVIALMVLRDGEADLERRSDGLRNWRLLDPEERGPGRVKVLAIRGEQATLRVVHEPLALAIEARATANRDAASGAPADDAMPSAIDAHGTWRGVPFVLVASTAEVLTLVETGRLFRLRGHVEAGGAKLALDGRVGDIVRWPEADARIAVDAPSLARLTALFGMHAGAAGQTLAVEATLRGDRERYELLQLHGKLGATDLAGELRWTRGEQRDALRVALASDSADLADLRALANRRTAATPARAAASASGAARPLDVELRFAAKRLRAADLPPLHGARIEASLVDGTLHVPSFELGVGSGRVGGNASIAVAARPVHGQAEVDVSALRIESLLGTRAAKGMLSGLLQGRAALRASGDSLEALLANAAGTVSAVVSDGTISSLLDAKMGLQGGKILRSMLSGAEPIALRCAAAVIDVRKGEGRIRTLVVDTEHTRTTGSGTIDLAHATMDVVLTPEAKEPGLFVLDRSIRLRGALREPKHELIARAAGVQENPRGCRAEKP